MNFDIEFNKLIDVLKDIAENLRRVAFEIEELHEKKEGDMSDFTDEYFEESLIHDTRFNFPIHRTEITSANILEVKVGTTGFCGGDSGHGGRTYFSIKDLGSTDITVNTIKDSFGCTGFEVILGGDCELATLINALTYIKTKLEEKADETV